MNEFQIKNHRGDVVGNVFCKSVEVMANTEAHADRWFVIFPDNTCALLTLHSGWRIDQVTK